MPVHLYIHVPFCARRCSYCDFAIAVRRSVPSEAFAELVLAEWTMHRMTGRWSHTGPFATVYLGGGTPSRLAPRAIGRILDEVARTAGLASDAEVTLEANPEDVDVGHAAGWRAAGVNRVSLGVQSFHGPTLTWMHRVHDAARPASAVRALRDAGFQNVSLDLIYGVPTALSRSWADDLAAALALEPEHLSLYGLTVETGTPLDRWVARGAVAPPAEEHAAAEYLTAHETLKQAGFRHYEVSNAARSGFESRHNRAGWRRRPYLGLGPSAHSQAGSRRWWNVRDWSRWRERVLASADPVVGGELLTSREVALEALYLGLRTDDGAAASSLPRSEVDAWVSAGWARQDGSRVLLTAEGWLRLDALVARLSRS